MTAEKPWLEIRRKAHGGSYRNYATIYRYPLRIWILGRQLMGRIGKEGL